MPVYDRRYRAWDGVRRPPGASAVGTLARYGLARIFDSRLATVLFAACCLPVVLFAVLVYAANNLDVLVQVGLRDPDGFRAGLEGALFFWFLVCQTSLGFLFTAFVGPSLIGPDLVHGALPLHLARPIGRAEYVAGKLAVLVVLLSALTWVPGLVLVGIQAALAEPGWLAAHWRLPVAIFVGAWAWILLVALIALAISAWVRWRPLATAMLFVVFLVGRAFGAATNEILGTRWGNVVVFGDLLRALWVELFGGVSLLEIEMVRDPLPTAVSLVVLALASALALALLVRRLEAQEVVR